MNIIIKYTQVKEFDEPTLEKIGKIQFSKIPEMKKGTYQANVLDQEELDFLEDMLGYFGEVDIIGKWNDDGSKIECDINKYRDALNNVQVFEKVGTVTRVKSSKRPTLTQARLTQVNVFNNKMIREL